MPSSTPEPPAQERSLYQKFEDKYMQDKCHELKNGGRMTPNLLCRLWAALAVLSVIFKCFEWVQQLGSDSGNPMKSGVDLGIQFLQAWLFYRLVYRCSCLKAFGVTFLISIVYYLWLKPTLFPKKPTTSATTETTSPTIPEKGAL